MELGIHYHTKRRTVHPGMYMVAGRFHNSYFLYHSEILSPYRNRSFFFMIKCLYVASHSIKIDPVDTNHF